MDRAWPVASPTGFASFAAQTKRTTAATAFVNRFGQFNGAINGGIVANLDPNANELIHGLLLPKASTITIEHNKCLIYGDFASTTLAKIA
jgi:hypothetical protein